MLKKQFIKNEVVAQHAWHRMLVIDVSGSMDRVIKEMMDGIGKIVASMSPSDFVTVGLYSDEYWWIIDRVRVRGAEQTLARILKDNAYTRTTTRFSGILTDAVRLRDTTPLQLCWFTDGYPVPDTRGEVADTLRALNHLRPESAVLVGYSNYNRKLLSEMADACGGMLVNATSLPHVMSVFQANLTNAASVGEPTQIDAPSFAIGETGLMSYPAGTTAYLNNTVLYTLADNGDPLQYVDMVALALYHNTHNNTPEALKVLAQTNDPYLYRLLARAHTNGEHARAEKAMWDAITNPRHRYVEGQHTVSLPTGLSVLSMLENMVGKSFKLPSYNRIGLATKTIETALKFVPQGDWAVGDVVYHSELNNVSIRAYRYGDVHCGDGAPIGTPSVIPHVAQHKTFTVIKDGELNMPAIEVAGEMISFEDHPVMSPQPVTADTIAELAIREAHLSTQLSTFRRLHPAPKQPIVSYSTEVSEWLDANGLRGNSWNPPRQNETSTDFYMANTFSVSVAGFSTQPKLAELRGKTKLTRIQSVAHKCIELYDSWSIFAPSVIDAMVAAEIDKINKELRQVRRQLNELRMIVLSTQQPLFADRQDVHKVTCGDNVVTFTFGKTKVLV